MTNNIERLLGNQLVVEVDIGVENGLDASVRSLAERLTLGAEDLREAAARKLSIRPLVDAALERALLRDDLRADRSEAGAFHGHDLRELLVHRAGDRVAHFWALKDGGPRGDVDVDILGVLVVAEESLRVFPAVETADVTVLGRRDHGEGFALAVTPVATLDVGGLDLAAVEDNVTLRVDEGLLCLSERERYKACHDV